MLAGRSGRRRATVDYQTEPRCLARSKPRSRTRLSFFINAWRCEAALQNCKAVPTLSRP